MDTVSNLSIGYWLIYSLFCFFILLFSVLTVFFFKKRRNLFLVICSSLLVFITVLFFSLPIIISKQTNNAIHQLDLYLKREYPKETWNITHTDPNQIEDTIRLHVRFHNEFNIVYEYTLHENSIYQSSYWDINGDSATELLESGVTLFHLE